MASTIFTGKQQEVRLSQQLFRTNVINKAEPSINSYSVITEDPIISQEENTWRLMSIDSPLISTSNLGFPTFRLSFDFCANTNIKG